ncbi:MAG: hypothetical protein M3075_18975 [Candidatus Dormibacteraeota bacterium]|nr:hypothetical protein [Candidatus Dormibacteraeota bacterium]
MNTLLTYGSGWLAAALLLAATPVPLLFRLLRRDHRVPTRRLRPPYWAGGRGAARVGHCLVSLRRARVPLTSEAGLWMANAAALMIVVEAVVGNRLRKPRQPDRARLRRRHLLLMFGAVLLGAVHVVLNGPFPR